MSTRHRLACVASVLSAIACSAAWAVSQADQSPHGPPPSTAAGAPSGLDHASQPSGMAAGTSINHDTVVEMSTDFIQQTAEEDAAEMSAAQYAIAQSRSPDVIQFARRILATKSHSTDELHDLAIKLGATMPSYPTAAQLRTLDALHADTGAKFDAAYAQFMSDEHTQALARFRRAAGSSSIDPSLRRYAQDSLPMMQDTLRQANRLVASHAGRTHTG